MEKKWRNCELHNEKDAEAIYKLKCYCKENNIPYEPSEAGNYTHFEIYCTAELAITLNEIIKYPFMYHPVIKDTN